MNGDTVSLWLSLANQLMLAFAIVFLIGMIAGLILERLRHRRAINATILNWVGRKRAELARGKTPPGLAAHDFKVVLDFYERSCRK